ncbi:MAG: DUF4215 domain-containing protein [Myxococcales bacterium]|nr:DUF4215 domain-containing protein [Myxococcales bacterium]
MERHQLRRHRLRVGRVEYEPRCGDGVIQPAQSETCDDGNSVSFDGCSATCRVETLFFSEYIEGSGGTNKAVEIANPSLTPGPDRVARCGCTPTARRPRATPSRSPRRSPAATCWWCNPSSVAAIRGQCDLQSNAVANWNGDDAIELFCGSASVDVIGQLGVDPGVEWGTAPTSTLDQTLRRKCSVSVGDANGTNAFNPATEWTSLGTNVFTDLGVRSCSP